MPVNKQGGSSAPVWITNKDEFPGGISGEFLRSVLFASDSETELAIDFVTNAIEIITTDHAAIHKGIGFAIYVTFDDVENNDTRNICITTSDDKYIHFKFYDVWIDNASGIVQLYENPQSVAGGTPVTPINRNRILSDVPSVETVVHTATINLTGATLLETLRFGGGGSGPQGRAGGDRSTDIEFVFKQSEQYVIQITNTSGVTADIGFWAFWYEEELGQE